MIEELIKRFDANRDAIKNEFLAEHPSSYDDIVRTVVSHITSEDEYGELSLDPERIHCIDDGDYQGTLLFVIGAKGYQPYEYWYVKVSYGSCSGCDTLESIRGYDDESVTEQQANDYFTLALHIAQGLTTMQG
jgi:hypothetical protein